MARKVIVGGKIYLEDTARKVIVGGKIYEDTTTAAAAVGPVYKGPKFNYLRTLLTR